jgi:hypothetical protein
METIDDEVLVKAKAFMEKSASEGKPWFVW